MYPLNYIPPLKKLNLKPLVSDPTLQIGQHKCPLLSTWPRNNAPKVVGGGEVEIPGGNFVVSNVVGGIIIPSTKNIFFLILFHEKTFWYLFVVVIWFHKENLIIFFVICCHVKNIYHQVLNCLKHPVLPGQPDHWVNLLLCSAESHRLIIGFNWPYSISGRKKLLVRLEKYNIMTLLLKTII